MITFGTLYCKSFTVNMGLTVIVWFGHLPYCKNVPCLIPDSFDSDIDKAVADDTKNAVTCNDQVDFKV